MKRSDRVTDNGRYVKIEAVGCAVARRVTTLSPKGKGTMPDAWDPTAYRDRAAAWRHRAMLCEDERQRVACIALAEGYERLAALLDTQAENLREPHTP